MSYKLTAQILDMDAGELDPTEKLLLVQLAHIQNHKTGQCKPSIAFISRKVGVSERQVSRLLMKLEGTDLLSVEKTPGESSVYSVTPTTPTSPPPRTSMSEVTSTSPVTPASPHPCHPCHHTPDMGDSAVLIIEEQSNEQSNEQSSISSEYPGIDLSPTPPPKPRPKPADDPLGKLCPEFDSWYQSYPRRQGRKQAYKAWLKNVKNWDDVTALTNGTLAAIRGIWSRRDKEYIPLPATWINSLDWCEKSTDLTGSMQLQRKPTCHDAYDAEGNFRY